MNKRVKEIRKKLGLTQEEFSRAINISRSNLGSIEIGRVNVTDRTVFDICREFGVREEWLRTGEGNMFEELSVVDGLIKDAGLQPSEYTIKILDALLSLPIQQREAATKAIYGLIDAFKKEGE